VQYFSDLPEARPRWRRPPAGDSTDVIHELIGKASTQLVLQTPYAVLSRRFARLLANLDPVVELRISSNSLASTDAFPVYAVSRKQRAFLLEELGAQLFEAKPYPPSPESFVPRYADLVAERAVGIKTPMRADPGKATREMPGPRLSLHGKIAVVDGRYSIVTSHNFDPRSEGYNTENGIIVDDAAFASALLASVGRITTPEYSWISAMRPAGEGLLAALHRDGARLSRRLPTLDLWPGYRFEIREASVRGAGSVGLAPEVVAWERRWVTAMISRMLGFLRPLM